MKLIFDTMIDELVSFIEMINASCWRDGCFQVPHTFLLLDKNRLISSSASLLRYLREQHEESVALIRQNPTLELKFPGIGNEWFRRPSRIVGSNIELAAEWAVAIELWLLCLRHKTSEDNDSFKAHELFSVCVDLNLHQSVIERPEISDLSKYQSLATCLPFPNELLLRLPLVIRRERLALRAADVDLPSTDQGRQVSTSEGEARAIRQTKPIATKQPPAPLPDKADIGAPLEVALLNHSETLKEVDAYEQLVWVASNLRQWLEECCSRPSLDDVMKEQLPRIRRRLEVCFLRAGLAEVAVDLPSPASFNAVTLSVFIKQLKPANERRLEAMARQVEDKWLPPWPTLSSLRATRIAMHLVDDGGNRLYDVNSADDLQSIEVGDDSTLRELFASCITLPSSSRPIKGLTPAENSATVGQDATDKSPVHLVDEAEVVLIAGPQLAERLNVSRRTLNSWVSKEYIAPSSSGGSGVAHEFELNATVETLIKLQSLGRVLRNKPPIDRQDFGIT